MKNIETIKDKYTSIIYNTNNLKDLDKVRISAVGKKGEISCMMQEIGKMSIDQKKKELENIAIDKALENESIDMSLPINLSEGTLHPVQQVMEEMAVIFSSMGFSIALGPDIEDDFHNFTALNFPPGHPARDMHDTFFMSSKNDEIKKVLRTHTSPVQIRTMIKDEPPIRIIAPGRTFRCDSDQTHTPMFHQVEGLYIDKGIHMGHLKGVLMDFVSKFFETEVEVQFRPHHFPFTEPSAEMDVRYERIGSSIKIGQGGDWMEILGCGMVHPNVLRACGVDPDEYQGFAFGMGVDRLAMLKYGMPDLRDMFSSDTRWLKHYGFGALQQANLATGLS